MMMASSSSGATAAGGGHKKICFNPYCNEVVPERPRKGWRLRNGNYVELCDTCGFLYETGRFCESFHSDDAGWRNCASCAKKLHCGCIVSTNVFVLLDAGGVDCLACARTNYLKASNQIQPPALFSSISDRPRDVSLGNWTPVPQSSGVAEQWRQPLNIWKSGSHQWMPFRVDNENKMLQDPSERILNLENDLVATRNAEIAEPGLHTLASGLTYEAHPNSFVHPSTSSHELSTLKFSLKSLSQASPLENGLKKVSGTRSQLQTPPNPLIEQFKKVSGTQSQLQTPLTPLAEQLKKFSGIQSQLQTPPTPLAEQFYNMNNGVDTSGENPVRNKKSRGDSLKRNQPISQSWPKLTEQELQQIAGNSNSVIKPLFEKVLSASDTGRIGRLVLPKRAAEAHLPQITHPDGLPLKVYDGKGNQWVFQYRFWPNNNSRMYVLEGVSPCIQELQLQAGDTVMFSRIDPEGKLIIGCRKTSDQQSGQVNQTFQSGIGLTNGRSKQLVVVPTPIQSVMGGAEFDNYVSVAPVPSMEATSTMQKTNEMDMAGSKSLIPPSKRKSSSITGPNNKSLITETEDLIELKVRWIDGQWLMRKPPNSIPNVMSIQGYEMMEFEMEAAPVIGKPTILCTLENIRWVQCESCSKWRKLPIDALLPSTWTCSDTSLDPSRSSCAAAQEVSTEYIQELASSPADGAKKKKKAGGGKKNPDAEVPEGLETLASLAIQEEGNNFDSSAQTTTRHPRHKEGCSCIVCIQPPSGKSHKDNCLCNACLTMRRRHQSLLNRRDRRQLEKDAEANQKLQLLQNPEDQDPSPEEKFGSPNKEDTDHSSENDGINLNQSDQESPLERAIREATAVYFKERPVVSSDRHNGVVVAVERNGGVDEEKEKFENGITHLSCGNQADGDGGVDKGKEELENGIAHPSCGNQADGDGGADEGKEELENDIAHPSCGSQANGDGDVDEGKEKLENGMAHSSCGNQADGDGGVDKGKEELENGITHPSCGNQADGDGGVDEGKEELENSITHSSCGNQADGDQASTLPNLTPTSTSVTE